MMKNKVLVSLCLIFLFNACSVKKYIPDGEILFAGSELIYTDEKPDKKTVKIVEEVLPQENKKLLGTYPGVYFHYKSKEEKPSFYYKFMNKQVGEKPVYMSDILTSHYEAIIKNRLENEGYFDHAIWSKINIDKDKNEAKLEYEIQVSSPFTLAKTEVIERPFGGMDIWDEIKKAMEETKLESGQNFNLSLLKRERERIDEYLKTRSYYNFNANFLIFEADTSAYADRRFNLYLRLKEDTPALALFPYKINNLEVFANTGLNFESKSMDTTIVDGIHFIQSGIFFKPNRLRDFLLIEPGSPYSAQKSRRTARRLNSIQTYRFVNIRYRELEIDTSRDYQLLDARILLSPANKRSIRIELQAVSKSNNFIGPNLNASFINRNIFKGGEQFSVSINGGYERQFLGGDLGGLSSTQLGLKNTLSFPRLLFPVDLNKRFSYSTPTTEISLGLDYLNRSRLFNLASLSSSFGYIWDQNIKIRHRLSPVNVEILQLRNTSMEFESILNTNPFLKRSFEQQFIGGMMYSLSYSEAILAKAVKKFLFFNFESAGNTFDLITRQSEGPQKIFGSEFAQYLKADLELRYRYQINTKGKAMVWRLFTGMGLPYNNSESLPFVKQFFAGGPYSIRSFRIRSVGPGTYVSPIGLQSFFDQAGDIRLEANMEYRFPIFSYIYGAVFLDAGNVWLLNENEALPGGKFTGNFINEIGAGTGIGLRIDIQGFVIRFDFAAPLKRPEASWRFEPRRTLLNFAIGYPF
jgi:outer membrane protein insertion porin family